MDSITENPVLIAAAVVAGTVLLLALLRSSSGGGAAKVPATTGSKERGLPASAAAEEEEEDTALRSAHPDAVATATTTGGGKKKKKKKKKSKQQQQAADAAVVPEAEVAEPEPATGGGGGGGKKKKKKKNKAGASNGAAAKTAAPVPAPAPSRPEPKEDTDSDSDSDDNDRVAAAKPVPQQPSSKANNKKKGPTKEERAQRQADLDDGWVIAEDKNKKKKKRRGAGGGAAASRQQTDAASAAAAGEVKKTVSFDAKKVGIIIGPKGATMQSIQEATDTKLDVNAPKEATVGQSASVVITGKAADVKRAEQAVKELLQKGYTSLTQEAGFTENSVSVHPRVLSEIVGPGGSVIRALQEKLGVKVSIPPTDWRPNQPQMGKVKHVRVGVAGPKDACIRAKAAIQSIARYHHHEITHPGLTHEEVDVPPEFLHCVIGPRGSEIRHIKGNYSCDVHIPNEDSYSEYVVVVGRPVMVEKAILHINNLMDRESERGERRYEDEMY